MKKLLTVVFVGMFCLSAANVSAKEGRKPRETRREKMINLQVENQLLKERLAALEQENNALKGESAGLLHSFLTGDQVQPWFANAEVQDKCQSILACRYWAYKQAMSSRHFGIDDARIEMLGTTHAKLTLVYRDANGERMTQQMRLHTAWMADDFAGLRSNVCVVSDNFDDNRWDVKAMEQYGGIVEYHYY